MIRYRGGEIPELHAVAALLADAHLRRPVHDHARLRAMLEASNVLHAAFLGERLVGLVRGWTDGAWEGYLCDLAVHPDVAREGVAEELLRAATDGMPGIRWTIPAEFVPRARLEAFGWIRNHNGWLLPREG